jgi:hypothetical protein
VVHLKQVYGLRLSHLATQGGYAPQHGYLLRRPGGFMFFNENQDEDSLMGIQAARISSPARRADVSQSAAAASAWQERPNRAEAAARTGLAGNASGVPELATGPIEAIRMLRVARAGAVKAKTAAANTLLAVLVPASEPLRGQLRQLSTAKLIDACLRLRPDTTTCTTLPRPPDSRGAQSPLEPEPSMPKPAP